MLDENKNRFLFELLRISIFSSSSPLLGCKLEMALNTQIEELSPSFHIDCDRALFLAVLQIHVDMEHRGTGVLVVVSFPLFKHYHHTNIFIFTSPEADRSYVTVGPGRRSEIYFFTMLTSILEYH